MECSFFFYIIYQAVGLLVGVSGVYLLMKYEQSRLFFTESYMTLPAFITFTSAALLLVTGSLGSWVSLKDSICLQGLVRLSVCVCDCGYVCFSVWMLHNKVIFFFQFVYLLVVVFCVESTASALAYYHSVKVCNVT